MKKTGANASVIFVPPPFAADAILEAVDAGIAARRLHHRGHPGRSTWSRCKRVARGASRTSRLIGPNCPGVITPGECKIGIMPGYIHKPGNVGVVSRSGTLTYEAVGQLTRSASASRPRIGIGGDPVNGMDFIDVPRAVRGRPETDGVIMIGEIGGTAEEDAAAFIKANMKKPVAGFIAGQTAPPGKRMGHAGAIISGGKGTAAEKIAAMRDAGIAIAATPADLGKTLARCSSFVKLSDQRAPNQHGTSNVLSDHQARRRRKGAIGGVIDLIEESGLKLVGLR